MPFLKSPLFIVIATQLLFTTSDLIARANMRQHPFKISTFLTGWFLFYFLVRQIAMFGQLYVFSALQIGKTMALFGATSIVIANVLGIFLLGELLSWQAYIGIAFAVLAFVSLAITP